MESYQYQGEANPMDGATATVLADLIMVAHFLVVAFIVGGLTVVWIGHFRGWHWIRNPVFRGVHLITIGVVALQAVFGAICPLTVWERSLREIAHEEAVQWNTQRVLQGHDIPESFGADETFVQHWLGKVLFVEDSVGEIPFVYLATAYCVFFAAVVFSFVRVRPRRLRWGRPGGSAASTERSDEEARRDQRQAPSE